MNLVSIIDFCASTVELEVAFGLENLGTPREEIGRRIDWELNVERVIL